MGSGAKKSIILTLLGLIGLAPVKGFAAVQKALDGHAVYCGQSKNLVQFNKILRLEVIHLDSERSEATVKISLVSDGCEGSGLDPAPRTYGSINIRKYTLTVTNGSTSTFLTHELNKLIENSTETVTFEVPEEFVGSHKPLELGVQMMGDVSESREMFQPYSGNFGVFIFKFDQQKMNKSIN